MSAEEAEYDPPTSSVEAEEAVTEALEPSQTMYIWFGLMRPFVASPPTLTLRKAPEVMLTVAEPESSVTEAPSLRLRTWPAERDTRAEPPDCPDCSKAGRSAASMPSAASSTRELAQLSA